MYKVVVFDMQGTLIRKDDVLSESLRRVLSRRGMDMPDGRAMRLYRMLPPYSFIKEYYALSPDDAGAIAREILAEKAGCAFIPSLYGYGFERDDSACPYPVPVLHDIRELPAALEKLER